MPTKAEQRIARARTHLLLDNPWFGTLALRMKMYPNNSIPSMGNNGTRLVYNEKYVAERTDKELIGLMAHEVMHAALGHMFRGKGRRWFEWNVAGDIVINDILRQEGFTLPPTPFEAEEKIYRGQTTEQIYAAREKDRQQRREQARQKGDGMPGMGNGGEDDGDPGENGHCDCGLEQAPEDGKNVDGSQEEEGYGMSAEDWRIAVEQATTVAKRAGKLSANMERLMGATKKTHTDWRTILRRFIEASLPSDYSLMNPNRRYISSGIYLPGIVKENTPRIGVAVDTSGSIDGVMLKMFADELSTIMHEVNPESIDVVYCDSDVKGREQFTPNDTSIVLHAKGGGGTAFQPALDEFNDDPPACVIYLTDLYGPAPEEPDYPVLWAVPEDNYHTEGPFGEFVKLSKYE